MKLDIEHPGKKNLRLFVGVQPTVSFREKMELQTMGLRPQLEQTPGLILSWVPASHLHITLKFLGNVPPSNIPSILEKLRMMESFAPFDLQLQGIGCFPEIGRPKVLWAGIQDPQYSLHKIACLLKTQLADLGFTRDMQPFFPHLTLARIKKGTLPRNWNATASIPTWGTILIEEIILFESKTHPSGPIYEKLHSFRLSCLSTI